MLSPDGAPADPPRAQPARAWPALLAALVFVAHALCYLPWTEDDAGITFRYAAHLATGRGLVYNPGERVEGISNLGYALLLAGVFPLLPGPDPRLHLLLAAKAIGLVAGLLALREAARLGRAIGLGPRAGAAALVALAGSAPLAAWSVGGLETPLVALAATALVAAAAEAAGSTPGSPLDRAPSARLAVAAGALVLLRADGFALPLAIAVTLLALRRPRAATRGAVVTGAGTVAALAATTGFRLAYYGRALPNPVRAKVNLAASLGALPATLAAYVLPFLRLHGGGLLLALLVVTALALAPSPVRRPRLVAAAAVAAVLGYAAAVGGDWMPLHRFLVPAVAPLVVLAAGGAAALLGRVAGRPAARASLPLVVALAAAVAAGEALAGRALFRTRRAAPFFWLDRRLDAETLHAFWLPPVRWLGSHLPPTAILVTSEAGFVPYLSGLRTVDSYGLATPAIAALPRDAVERSPLGVLARFTETRPAGPAELLLAATPADAIVLQSAMVRGWNRDRVPAALFAGAFVRAAGDPEVPRWEIYVPSASAAPAAAGGR